MTVWEIRAATPWDLAAVASCADLAFGFPRSPDNRVELALQIQEGSVHVICDAARVLGYISFSPNRDHLYVDAIAVLPRLHRQGLGSRLLAFAEQEALRLGLRSVRLFTNGEIAGNLIFYRQRGYHETGRCVKPASLACSTARRSRPGGAIAQRHIQPVRTRLEALLVDGQNTPHIMIAGVLDWSAPSRSAVVLQPSGVCLSPHLSSWAERAAPC